MKNVMFAVFVVGIVGAFAWAKLKPRYPTPMEFTDAAGATHSFAQYQQQATPVVVTFFSDRDSFSPRSLALFQKLRDEYSEEQLAIVGFHLESASAAALVTFAQAKQYTFSLVPVRADATLGLDLYKTLDLSNAGDVAIIDKRGRVSKVISTKDLTQAELEEKVRKAVANVISG